MAAEYIRKRRLLKAEPEGAFKGKGYPKIVDVGVSKKYRNQGIGTVLMDIAEQIATTYANRVYLGVVLHSGYGRHQRHQ